MAADWTPPSDRRFPPERRLHSKKEFDKVFQEGRKIVRPSTILFYLLKPDGEPRLGLAVSRKTGKAVVRNRIKRRLRDIFRNNLNLLPAPLDLVIVARHNAGALSYEELRSEYLSALKKIG